MNKIKNHIVHHYRTILWLNSLAKYFKNIALNSAIGIWPSRKPPLFRLFHTWSCGRKDIDTWTLRQGTSFHPFMSRFLLCFSVTILFVWAVRSLRRAVRSTDGSGERLSGRSYRECWCSSRIRILLRHCWAFDWCIFRINCIRRAEHGPDSWYLVRWRLHCSLYSSVAFDIFCYVECFLG